MHTIVPAVILMFTFDTFGLEDFYFFIFIFLQNPTLAQGLLGVGERKGIIIYRIRTFQRVRVTFWSPGLSKPGYPNCNMISMFAFNVFRHRRVFVLLIAFLLQFATDSKAGGKWVFLNSMNIQENDRKGGVAQLHPWVPSVSSKGAQS